MHQKLAPDPFWILLNNPKQLLHARNSFKNKIFWNRITKDFKKLTSVFLLNPVLFNVQSIKNKRSRSIWKMKKKKKKKLAGKSVSTNRKKVSLKKSCYPRFSKTSTKLWIKEHLFPLDRKSVSTSWKEELVKKTRFHLTGKLFS